MQPTVAAAEKYPLALFQSSCAAWVPSWHTVCVPSVGATTAEIEGASDQDWAGGSSVRRIAGYRARAGGAVYASLIPRLDMLKSLGLVWIPGVMAGMMVSGANPVNAGIYQFVVVAMILASSGAHRPVHYAASSKLRLHSGRAADTS
jgi:hypothetical protein